MVTRQLARSYESKSVRSPLGNTLTGPEISTSRQLTLLRDDIASLSREGVVALRRWYRYRKAVRELSNLEDHALREVGLNRDEVDITAYCLAEQAVSARPHC